LWIGSELLAQTPFRVRHLHEEQSR
jgi:hypothetical protein